MGGNAFISEYGSPGSPGEEITEEGLDNWISADTVFSIFFRMSRPETIRIDLRLRIPRSSQSKLKVSFPSSNNGDEGAIEYEINIADAMGGEYQNIQVGQFDIQEGGYVRFNLQGIMRTGEFFAQVSHLLLSHELPDNEIVFNSTQESYWGRRGPSVHLRYPISSSEYSAEYFYNEVSVPEGADAIGLYAMATGFSGGYFGIQVNGPVERRVLFSIWSEFDTDDPGQIPEDYRVKLIRKGPGVFVGQFGDEGSGAQSYVKFNWRAGNTYRFLVRARPLDSESTEYTAWFKRPESQEWQLVASFNKPKVSIYLKDLYSFLENFDPEQGHLERQAHFGNQWIRDSNGQWLELTECRFTGDATSRLGRRDFAGGLKDDGTNMFFLRHCGFFSDSVPTNQNFYRAATGNEPDVDVENLP